ncbi:MAG: hypothetical protein GY813_07225 [Halieaceae bacterium]|nr:hypothetical protein [Halieaceae bacterium]
MKLLLTETTLAPVQNYVEKCAKSGDKFHVTIKKYKRNRSLEQNAKLHALFRSIANHTGNTVGEIKDYCCTEYLGDKCYEFRGRERTRSIRTSEINTAECADFIERVQQLAAELGAEASLL